MKTIILKRGKEESVERLHPWIFSGAIGTLPADLTEGETVRVVAHDGRFLGAGHYQIGSIAVRLLTHDDRQEIDGRFYLGRLEDAFALRRALRLVSEQNRAYRLVHGEGDFLPGLVVDVYGQTAVMQAHSPGMHYAREMIAEALTSLPEADIHNVYYKSETTLPFMARLEPENGLLRGTGTGDSIALENGFRFNIDWLRGQKTGFFIDQRDNRQLLRHYSAGRRVLNMFCYTGGFSVYALAGGAERVVSVDSSARAIALTRENVALNFDDETTVRHQSEAVDAFRYLEEMAQGEFDLIVLDPPAFAKHRSAVGNALRGYRRLNALGISKVVKGGIVFTFSCSQAITKEQFRLAVFTAAAQTGRRVRILHQLTQPADHPVSIYHPEGEYLKGLVLYVE